MTPQPVRPSPADPAPKAPSPAPSSPTISPDSAGAVKLGMPASEVKKLPNLTVLPWDRKVEGQPVPTLRIQQFGLPIGYAELEEGKVWRIVIVSEGYRTAEGAHVGMTARQLEAVYGPGQVLIGEGNVCATFEKAPGLSFCFQDAPALLRLGPGDWTKLTAKNPRVQRIFVVGTK